MAMIAPYDQSIAATFVQRSEAWETRVAMRHKEYGLWQEITWGAYYRHASYVAHALMGMGIEKGDCIGVIGENSPEWLYIDMGTQMAGACTVGIYTTSAWPQVKYILDHSECKILFAENEEQVDKWLHMRDHLPQLKYVVYWDRKGLERLDDPQLIDFTDLLQRGKQSFIERPKAHHDRIRDIQADDTAILVYTSGTTGQPKGAVLTSRNILWVAHNIHTYNSEIARPGDDTISFLPLCHIFERQFGAYFPLLTGHTINIAESPETVAANLREIRPTVGYGVPRIWEKYQSSILIRMADAPWFNRQVFNVAIRVGNTYVDRKLAKQSINPGLRLGYWVAYWTIFHPIKYMVGMNRMRIAFSGAAPISTKVLRFYHMLGITMIEGYGMTETSVLITFSKPDDFKLGTVGKIAPGAEIKLAEDGEILVKHPGVISGYYKDPEATARALENGWLRTGDVGTFDGEGYLTIVDRKKDIIITAGGKNIAPQKIENLLKASIYINDAIVIGDRRKYLTAIIVLDEDNINKYARDHKIQYASYSDLASHPDILKLIDKEVQAVNKELARVENIRKFTILDKRLYVEDGEVTPTMKVKRSFIDRQYRELIEAMY